MKKTIHSQAYKALTLWLRSCRESKGLTIRDLGEKLNLPHSTVSKIETHDRRLDIVEYVRYCKALEVDPEEGLRVIVGELD